MFWIGHETAFDSEIKDLKIYRLLGTPSLPLLLYPLWPGVVDIVWVPSMVQIDLFKNHSYWDHITVYKISVLKIVQTKAYNFIEIVTLNHIIVYKLLVLDWNTCNYISKSKVGDRRRGWPEGYLFNSNYTEVYGRALLLSLDCSTLPLISTLYCWVLNKEVSSTIFKVFGMTWPGIEPRSSGPLGNTLPTKPMSRMCENYLYKK